MAHSGRATQADECLHLGAKRPWTNAAHQTRFMSHGLIRTQRVAWVPRNCYGAQESGDLPVTQEVAMSSKLLIIATPVALALLASVAFAEQGEAPELGSFFLPASDMEASSRWDSSPYWDWLLRVRWLGRLRRFP